MRDPEASLADIVTYARRVVRYTEGTTRDSFVRDTAIQDQVIRCLGVIGEAARRVPHEERERFPAVPWVQVVGMRNRLAHEYDGIDMDTVWRTATEDVPVILVLLEGSTNGRL
ncbi:MAG: HepT-like ribonuclease domain-containing protein [Coriobacteriia bacterium]